MKQNLKIEYVDIKSIKMYSNNAKLHPKEQIQQIKNSILEFGFNDPLALWHDTIVEGHGRLLAAKELGYKELPIIRLDDLSDEQRKAYCLAHNKLTMNSDFDLDVLSAELDSILNIDMSDFGFDLDLIEDEKPEKEAKFNDSISVVIDCDGETQAEEIYNKLTEEGYVCRISTL
jgi:ParB-like chromosome segregation protein Spo0J